MKVFRFPIPGFATVLLTVLLAGCATRKIDWASRVGDYTFDQAVVEYGPPDKQAKLTDGTLVAEWLTQHGYRPVYAGGFCRAPLRYAAYPPYYYIDTYAPDYFLRLTFGADGRLQSWKRLSK